MLAQMRLAWWRDRLRDDPAQWPRGEPLLARLASWRGLSDLAALADGWEALLGERPLGRAALEECIAGRAAGLTLLARQFDADESAVALAARRWAAADLVLHLDDPVERETAMRIFAELERPPRLSHAMRPLAVLSGLNARAVLRGDEEALSGIGAIVAAIRLGLSRRPI